MMQLINLLLCILAVSQNSWAPIILMFALSGHPVAVLVGIIYSGHRLSFLGRDLFVRIQDLMTPPVPPEPEQESPPPSPPWWHLQALGSHQFVSPSLAQALDFQPRGDPTEWEEKPDEEDDEEAWETDEEGDDPSYLLLE